MDFSRIKAPNTLVLIFSIVILIAILTWILPSGEFNRVLQHGKSVVENQSYHSVASNPHGLYAILMAPIKGFIGAASVIGFIIFVGGAFGVFQKTEAIDSGIKSVAKAYNSSKLVKRMLIPIFMILFSLGGAVFGMSEEIIPFIMVFVPMALILGYDSITGVAIPFLGASAGFAGAFMNPFTVGIAQGIAELPLFSGIEYRIFVWFVITGATILFVTLYAEKIKRKPQLSPTYDIDKQKRNDLHITGIDDFKKMSGRHKAVLITIMLSFLILVYGVRNHGWFINEICGLFVATGIIAGLIGKLKLNDIAIAFIDGAKAMVSTAIVIALARGILVVATDGKIIDTILYYLSNSIDGLHPVVSSQAMFVVQSLLNFFVPSGSGQAALTMPIMAPLGDLVGVSRQTAVLAFQFGDGFSNMIIPTSAVTMGVLTLANIPWEKWAKWIIRLQILLLALGMLLLIPPYFLGW